MTLFNPNKNSTTDVFRCAIALVFIPSMSGREGESLFSCSLDGAYEQSQLCATSQSRGEP